MACCTACRFGGLRFILLSIHYLIFITGLFLVCIGIFIGVGPFAESEPDLFESSGILLGLLGAVLTVLGILCAQALTESENKFANGCSGLVPMSVAQLCITALIPPLIVLLAGSTYIIDHFKDVRDDLRDSDDADGETDPSYIDAEVFIRNRFNDIFFEGVEQCDGSFSWFWSWVNEYCDEDLSEEACEKCSDVSITFCRADQNTCFSENRYGVGRACPYSLCREKFANYVVSRVATPMLWSLSSFLFLFTLAALIHFILYCWIMLKRRSAVRPSAELPELNVPQVVSPEESQVQEQHEQITPPLPPS